MKTLNTLLIVLAAGFAATVVAVLSNTTYLATVAGDKLMAIALSIGYLLFAVRDYARRPDKIPLRKPAALLRPVLPVTIDARQKIRLPGDRAARAQNSAA